MIEGAPFRSFHILDKRLSMKKITGILVLFLLIGSNAFAQSKVLDKLVGIVGDEIILFSELQENLQYVKSQQGVLPEGTDCYILDQLLTQRLLLNTAKLDSIEVADEEVEGNVDARIQQILGLMGGDEEQFEAYYGMTIFEVRDKFREDMKAQLLTQRMQETIVAEATITPAEAKDFFDLIPKDSLPYFNSEVEIGELVLYPKVNKEEEDKAFNAVATIRKQVIEEGADFGEIASRVSDDPGSKTQGGNLGWVKRGTLVPEFEAAVFRLERNEYSPIVETEYGFHLIQLLERRGNSVNARHILIKPNITEADKQITVKRLDSIRNLIVIDSLNFVAAVKLFSDDEQSKNNAGILVNPATGTSYFEIGDLDPMIYFTVDTMDVGDVSSPVEFDDFTGDPTYKLLKLRSRTNPHLANMKDDYFKIQRAALEQKKALYLDEWLAKKSLDAYIMVANEYSGCPVLEKWDFQTTP